MKSMQRISKAGGYHLLELNQTEIAGWFDVDRTTITQWQRDGMPYISHGKGKPNSYDAYLCSLWEIGRGAAKKRKLPRQPTLTYILMAWLCAERDEPATSWMPRARNLAKRISEPHDDDRFIHCLATAMNLSGHVR